MKFAFKKKNLFDFDLSNLNILEHCHSEANFYSNISDMFAVVESDVHMFEVINIEPVSAVTTITFFKFINLPTFDSIMSGCTITDLIPKITMKMIHNTEVLPVKDSVEKSAFFERLQFY